MKRPDYLAARDYAGLKTAFARLMDAIGGQSAAARIVRVGQPRLSQYASLSEEHADCFAPLDAVADLEAELTSRGGKPLVAEHLAELAGFELTAKDPARPAERSWCAAIGAIAQEFGDLAGRIGTANADGAVDQREAAECLREAEELKAEVERVIEQLKASGANVVRGPVRVHARGDRG